VEGGDAPVSPSNLSYQTQALRYDPYGNKIWIVTRETTGSIGSICAIDLGAISSNSPDVSTGLSRAIVRYKSGTTWFGTGWSVVVPHGADVDASGNPVAGKSLRDVRRFLLIGSNHKTSLGYGKRLYVLNLQSPEAGWRVLTTTDASGGMHGFIDGTNGVYHHASRAVVCWNLGFERSLLKLSLPEDPWSAADPAKPRNDLFQWTELKGAGVAPTTTASNFNGVFSKFNIIENMGNGRSLLLTVLDTKGPVFVYKLPERV
jgi:hypothetical protein